jgi:hypothetical protein
LAGRERRTLLLLLGAGLGSALGGLFLRHGEGRCGGSDSDLLSVTCARQDCDQCSMEERRCGRRGG